MAIARVEKVHILAHTSVKRDLLSSLQEEGLVQLEEANHQDLELHQSTPQLSDVDHKLHRLSHALDYLSLWEEKGLAKKLLSQKPQLHRRRREEVLDSDYMELVEKIEEIEKVKNEFLSEIKFLEKEEEFLLPLGNLELPVKSARPTESTDIFLARLPLSQWTSFQEMIEGQPLWFEVIDQDKRNIILLLIFLKSERSLIDQSSNELSLTPIVFSEAILELAHDQDRVEEVISRIRKEIEARERNLKEIEIKSQNLCEHRDKLMFVYDVLLNEREKMSCSRLLGETESVFFLEGWIPSSDVENLKSKIKPFEDLAEIHSRPPLPEEEPPVILENPRGASPFEVVTKLYGLPLQGTLDPTLFLAPFFFLFVGLCVSEAGYGLVVAAASLLFIKFAKPKGGLLLFLKLLALLGISTVILGTLVGGWFGFPIRKFMILDPLQDPLSFLILALVLGFIQVWFGTLLNLINGIKNKNYLQSIAVQGGWLLLLPSLVLYLLRKSSVWGILALVGAAGIVFFAAPSRNPLARFFGGLYSLYDISRYLADILSYSRLLALGLATSVIAMVVNTLCQTALGIPWLGWLLAALIFVGGHLFNLGISFLGGFVHSMRLQFVEFFSKFFKSGGKPFKPFSLESKYIEFI